MAEFREKLFAEEPELRKNIGEIGKRGGVRWKELSDEEKAPFEALSAKDKVRYEKEMSKYTPPAPVFSTALTISSS